MTLAPAELPHGIGLRLVSPQANAARIVRACGFADVLSVYSPTYCELLGDLALAPA
jgi:anti-anti-sigma regulatory factor